LVGAKELYFKLGRLHEGDWGLGGIKDWGEIHVDRVFISLTTVFLVGGEKVKIPGQVLFDPWPGSPYRFWDLHTAVERNTYVGIYFTLL